MLVSLGCFLMALMAAGVAGADTPTVEVATNSSFGTILANAAGMALYTLETDHNGQSTCHGACAAAWPPLTVAAGTAPTGGPGVTGTVAAAKQTNGTFQVTYNGSPLYTFVGDTAPGQVTGNGVSGFFVVVTHSATTTTTTVGGAPTGTSSPTGPSSPTGTTQSSGTPTASGTNGSSAASAPTATAAGGARVTGGSLAFTGPGPGLGWLLLLGLVLVTGGVALSFGGVRRALWRDGRH